MEVTKLNGFFGAEIQKIDLVNITDENIDDIKQLWLTHKVLVLRNQVLTLEEHINFSRRFGDLEVHPFGNIHPEHPEVLVLDEVGDDMSVQDLQEMHKVLVAYLEYKIPGVDDTETCKLLRKVANVPRTIIWSGFKRTLQPYVDAKNFMLVVKDSSKIIFTAPDGAW